MPKYYTEVIRRIYEKTSGEYVEVSPDEDALGSVKIGVSTNSLYIDREAAAQVAAAIIECAKEIEHEEAP